MNSTAGTSLDPKNVLASRPYRRCDELRIVRAQQRRHLAQREPAVSDPVDAAQQEARHGEAHLRSVELWLAKGRSREGPENSRIRTARRRVAPRPVLPPRLGLL